MIEGIICAERYRLISIDKVKLVLDLFDRPRLAQRILFQHTRNFLLDSAIKEKSVVWI
jgi:hypothetical protein